MFKFKNNDIGIDLGTANLLIYRKGEGVILNQPSVVAIDKNGEVKEVGESAYAMIGRSSANVSLVRPLRDGVIADFQVTQAMLDRFLNELNIKGMFKRPRILICCPTNVTTVERNAIKDVAVRSGAKEVYVEEEPKVAAVGAGINIYEPVGNMVIDIGGGTTDIAVLSLGEIVTSASVKIAGDIFTQDIVNYIKNKYHLLLGLRTAEDIKKSIGVVADPDESVVYEVKGRDLVDGLPKVITLTEADIVEALNNSVTEIIRETKSVLEETEPELAADIINQGIVLTGGGALIKNFDKLLQRELNVPVFVTEDPLNSVVHGAGMLLEMNDDPNSPVNLSSETD